MTPEPSAGGRPSSAIWVQYRRIREWARQEYRRADKAIADRFFAYDREALASALRQLGVKPGDTLMVHSAFRFSSGFQGSPQDIIQALLEVLGDTGNLMMVSMPFGGSAYEYLQGNPVFDVRKTPSRMGILSEIFRRRKDVVRSLHPTHPVLACGPRASWLVEGHERCPYPCGKGTPFDKLRQLGGKTLFFDVPLNTFTFIHFIEDHIKEHLPVALYVDTPLRARVVDADGRAFTVETYAFSREAAAARSPDLLQQALERDGLVHKARIGRTALMLVEVEAALKTVERMVARGQPFYAS
jgi:aminoglycoside 3-N-acetyltransferase